MTLENLTQELDDLDYGKQKRCRQVDDLEREIRFTHVYQQYADAPPYIREGHCLRSQTRDILTPIQDGDLFAGRIDRMFVGIDPERGDLIEAAYFCQFELLRDQLARPETPPNIQEKIRYLLDFWQNECTWSRCRAVFPEHLQQGMPTDDYYLGRQISFPMYGLGGPCLDYEKLVTLGISGLRELVTERKTRAIKEGHTDTSFFDGMLMALEIFSETALRYASQARKLANHGAGSNKSRYTRMADSLEHISEHPPKTLHQAIQLVWLYNLHSLTKNYGRMDLYLGDFLERDLESGRLTEEQALEMLVGLWRLIVDRGDHFNNRIIIGGRGRRNEKSADRFALLALEAQRIINHAIPQLSLRWYDGMNQEIWDKAFQVLATGSTMPIIYNDDINIPGIGAAMQVPLQAAEQYAFYGCGEFLIDHQAVASPDAALNVLKTLDVTLRNGMDGFTGDQQGLELGHLGDYKTFEELQSAFTTQLEHQISMLATAQDIIYRETGSVAAFPFLSLLYDDCIERGAPLLAGGVRYASGTLESFGNNTAADALYAIKKLVYDEKRISAQQLIKSLDANFDGFNYERSVLMSVSKYGNDHPEADAMSLWLNHTVCDIARRQKENTSLHSFLVVMINNGDSVLFGKTTAASADGRLSGAPVSNGNQPGSGNDTNGVTALLNSLAKLDPSVHAGVTNNIKFARATMRTHLEKIKALVRGYFANGGTQIMLTSVDRGELEDALVNPAAYRNLFVRVGGYSERFVDLPREIQMEIINRTLYE